MARGRRKKEVVVEPTGPARILVVNDEDGASELLGRILERAGYLVRIAASHDDALVALGHEPPECVVLDLATGGIGQNLKLLDAVRTHIHENVARARVVLVAHQSNNRLFSWQAGIDAFLLRPFHADELERVVAEVLARPDDEREQHRRRELDAASGAGRTVEPVPWNTQRF
jgi:DNA-binding response OmpR family regulator